MIADRLKSYVPEFIADNTIFQDIYNSQGTEIDNASAAVNDIVNQCFVDTATWGLKFWEGFLGIAVDEGKEINYRRSVIKSKIRGDGTVTVSLMKSVAQSYDNGEIDIVEHNDSYSFEVKFVGTKGIPPNLEDLKKAIEDIKPAHLAVTYTFTYTVWQEVKSITWGQVKTGTWEDLKTRMVI